MILKAAGGECREDFDRRREDGGLAELIGPALPSPAAARNFLYEFHAAAKIAAAKPPWSLGQGAYLPGENEAWPGLAQVNRDWLQALGARCADQKIATVDQDAPISESRQREAQPPEEGARGYPPLLAGWVETGAGWADEFRDGKVPAPREPLPAAPRALAARPPTLETFYFRGDSAGQAARRVHGRRNEEREDGPPGFRGFALSARRSEGLPAALLAVPAEAGQR